MQLAGQLHHVLMNALPRIVVRFESHSPINLDAQPIANEPPVLLGINQPGVIVVTKFPQIKRPQRIGVGADQLRNPRELLRGLDMMKQAVQVKKYVAHRLPGYRNSPINDDGASRHLPADRKLEIASISLTDTRMVQGLPQNEEVVKRAKSSRCQARFRDIRSRPQ